MARPEVHALYIALADKGVTGRQAVGYLSGITGPLERQGVSLEVYRIRPKDLCNPRVLGALRRRGIDRLPAMLARGRPLIGLTEIRDFYETQLAPLAPPRGGADVRGFAQSQIQRRGSGARPSPASEPRLWAPPGADARAPERETAIEDNEGSPEEDLDEFFRQEMMIGGSGELGDA